MDTCKLCSLEITGYIVTNHLLDKYHKGCFVCASCTQELVDPYFTDNKTGTNYCAKCNIIRNDLGKANRDKQGHCNTCYKFLNEDEDIITIDQEKYHHSCFKCFSCKQVIPFEHIKEGYNREQMTSKSSNYCCNTCLNSGRVDKCDYCKGVILTSSQSVNGKCYHLKCLKCFNCSEVIKSNTPFSINKQTNNTICQNCS